MTLLIRSLLALSLLFLAPFTTLAQAAQFDEQVVKQAIREATAGLQNDPAYRALPDGLLFTRPNAQWSSAAEQACQAEARRTHADDFLQRDIALYACTLRATLYCWQWRGARPARLAQAVEYDYSAPHDQSRPINYPDCPANLSGWTQVKDRGKKWAEYYHWPQIRDQGWPARGQFVKHRVWQRLSERTRASLDPMQQRVDRLFDTVLERALGHISDGAIPADTKSEIRRLFKGALYVHAHETQGQNKIRNVYRSAAGQTLDITDEREIISDSLRDSRNIQIMQGDIDMIVSRRLNPALTVPLSDRQQTALVASIMGQLQSIEQWARP